MPHPRLLNPSGMAVSIVIHLTVLTVGLGYAGVRPFETAPVEAIAVILRRTSDTRVTTNACFFMVTIPTGIRFFAVLTG